MAKKESDSNFTGLWMVLVFMAALAAWMFLSTEYLVSALSNERKFLVEMAGAPADQWVYGKMIGTSMEQLKDVNAAIKTEKEKTGAPEVLSKWIQERIIVTWLWGSLIMYRLNLLLLFFFILMPFTIAIAADGFYNRTIRTFRFSSQSPIRHRLGVIVLTMATAGGGIWILLPFPIPSIIAPLVIVFVGLSTWIWATNLQKRI